MTPRLPDDLAERPRWAVWRTENGRKVPYQVNGYRASSVNPQHWGESADAIAALASGKYRGLAFAFFRQDGFVGMDLDDSLNEEGNIKPQFAGIVERFADTYMEVSPSGCGIKIWAKGALPANLPTVAIAGGGGVELYDHARYFTFTGRAFRGAPLEVADHAADVLGFYHKLTAGKAKSRRLQPLQGGRIPYGQQHSTLVSLAGTLRARRVCDEAIEACLQAVNAHQCEKPGPAENIRAIVRSTRPWGVA